MPLVALVSVAVNVWTPAAKAFVGVTDHVPAAATTAVPIALVPSCNVTVSPAWPLPEITGFVTFVMSSPLPRCPTPPPAPTPTAPAAEAEGR